MSQINTQRQAPTAPTNGKARWAGIGLTALIGVLALTVQWGVVTTKLDQVGRQLDDLTEEIHSLRSDIYSIERRVSYLEGRLNGRSHSQAGDTP
jgi:hypothetical protein